MCLHSPGIQVQHVCSEVLSVSVAGIGIGWQPLGRVVCCRVLSSIWHVHVSLPRERGWSRIVAGKFKLRVFCQDFTLNVFIIQSHNHLVHDHWLAIRHLFVAGAFGGECTVGGLRLKFGYELLNWFLWALSECIKLLFVDGWVFALHCHLLNVLKESIFITAVKWAWANKVKEVPAQFKGAGGSQLQLGIIIRDPWAPFVNGPFINKEIPLWLRCPKVYGGSIWFFTVYRGGWSTGWGGRLGQQVAMLYGVQFEQFNCGLFSYIISGVFTVIDGAQKGGHYVRWGSLSGNVGPWQCKQETPKQLQSLTRVMGDNWYTRENVNFRRLRHVQYIQTDVRLT